MVIFYLIIWLVKASFIIIYFEFDWDLGEGTRKFLYITAGTIMVTFAFVELTHMLWCLPLDQNWYAHDSFSPGGSLLYIYRFTLTKRCYIGILTF